MSIDKIKTLRDKTGLPLGEIRKALDKANGDESEALEILNRLGGAMAAQKASREVKEGVIDSYVHTTKKVGSLVEILCETDFVARNDDFKNLAHDIAMHVTAMKPTDNEELLGQAFIKDPSLTIKELIESVIAKVGENIQIGKFEVFEI